MNILKAIGAKNKRIHIIKRILPVTNRAIFPSTIPTPQKSVSEKVVLAKFSAPNTGMVITGKAVIRSP